MTTPEERLALENKTDEELFQAALQGDYDDEVAWEAVAVLRLRGTGKVFKLAAGYCRSPVALERARGLNVLAQLGARKSKSERPHFDESVAIAIHHLRDQDELVVYAAAWALSHLGSDAAISALIDIKKNPDPDVRWAVANGLNESNRTDAIATIVELMDDSDDNVRDWATFALGTQCKMDTPEIREALRKRLADGYEDARDEAVWGLAKRKDEYAINVLLHRLMSEEWKAGDEMAARDLLGKTAEASVNELCEGLRKLQA